MTLQELEKINSIAIKADVDFEDILDIIGCGAADIGMTLDAIGKDTTKMRIICDEIDKLIERM